MTYNLNTRGKTFNKYRDSVMVVVVVVMMMMMIIIIIIIIKFLKIYLWLTAPRGATPVN